MHAIRKAGGKITNMKDSFTVHAVPPQKADEMQEKKNTMKHDTVKQN